MDRTVGLTSDERYIGRARYLAQGPLPVSTLKDGKYRGEHERGKHGKCSLEYDGHCRVKLEWQSRTTYIPLFLVWIGRSLGRLHAATESRPQRRLPYREASSPSVNEADGTRASSSPRELHCTKSVTSGRSDEHLYPNTRFNDSLRFAKKMGYPTSNRVPV